MSYACVKCGRPFASIGGGVQWRTPDEEGDAEVRCPHCGYWASPDHHVWVLDVKQETDDDPMGYGQLTDDDDEPRKDFPRWQ